MAAQENKQYNFESSSNKTIKNKCIGVQNRLMERNAQNKQQKIKNMSHIRA